MSQGGEKPGSRGGSRLAGMQAQFQQRQKQDKEEKLLHMLNTQQQRGMQKAGLSGVIPPKYGGSGAGNGPSAGPGLWSNHSSKSTTPTPSRTSPTVNNPIPTNPGKVRQMFEERRKGGGAAMNGASNTTSYRAGIDKSYPLDPLVVDGSKTNLGSKNRSLSSKSDPPPPTTHSRSGPIKAAPPLSRPAPPRTLPPRLIPTPPLPNVGSKTRANVLGRKSPADPLPPSRSPLSGQSRGSSSGSGGNLPPDENGNDLRSSSSQRLPPVATSTKYRDYVNGFEASNELAERESALGSKMKNLSLSAGRNVDTYNEEIRSSDSRSNVKSAVNVRKPPVAKASQNNNVSAKSSKVGPIGGKTGSNSQSPVERPPPGPGMEECRICHRHFANDRIEKHESICKKAATKKRKVFDPTKMRMQGTEAEPYLRTVSAKSKKPAAAAAPAAAATGKKADWRKKHEEFINAIRAAKEFQAYVAKGGNPADLPPPVPSENADYVQCPHCKRKFNAGAAERHIPKCQNIKSNKR